MNIYEVTHLEREIERAAAENNGEIPEALLEELVKAETKSVQQVENLCKYIRHLELGVEMCTAEINRISSMRARAEIRIENIKKYLAPFVKAADGVEAGTFKLNVRKSERVIVEDGFADPEYCNFKEVVQINPDKNKIKAAIKAGKDVPGAKLEVHDNLQIK